MVLTEMTLRYSCVLLSSASSLVLKITICNVFVMICSQEYVGYGRVCKVKRWVWYGIIELNVPLDTV